MSDKRCKDAIWDVETCDQSGKANVALLMDLRDELQTLNTLLRCPNFLSLPREIQGMHLQVSGLRRDFKKLQRRKTKRGAK